VNGKVVAATVEPRTHLADYLREELRLTGTHLGCEHGVCGACTVLLDDKPVRSCITFAAACEGAQVVTIEGYDQDPVMAQLRAAFHQHHALQCGYCTPGMLATARDIVLRLPAADELTIRRELSGNLCRCTGYVGIVAAIRSVLDARSAAASAVDQAKAESTIVGLPAPISANAPAFTCFTLDEAAALPAETAPAAQAQPIRAAERQGWTRVEASFKVPHPAAEVWRFMADLPAVAACLPGAALTEHAADKVAGQIAIKFGPMSASFKGSATLERDDAAQRAVLRGEGRDSLSNSTANGDVAYALHALAADATEVKVDLQYALQGPLAQFSRSGLVRDFVQRMVADFGRNVARRMDPSLSAAEREAPAAMNPVAMFAAVLWARLKRLFGMGHN